MLMLMRAYQAVTGGDEHELVALGKAVLAGLWFYDVKAGSGQLTWDLID